MIRKTCIFTSLLAVAAVSCSFAFSSTDLLFYANQNNVTLNTDNTIATWGSGITFNSYAAQANNTNTVKIPTVASLTNATTGLSANWVRPVPGDLNPVGGATLSLSSGSAFSSAVLNSDTKAITNNGFTIVAAINPDLNSYGSSDIRRIVDIFGGGLMLGVKDNGELYARFLTYNSSTNTWSNNSYSSGSTKKISAAPIVVSLTMTTGGVYNVWADNTLFLTGTSGLWTGASLPWNNTTSTTMSAKNTIGIGSSGWGSSGIAATTFRGYLGDTYVYKSVLSDTDRLALIDEVKTSMGMTAPVITPEPGSIAALLTGLSAMALIARRRK